MDKKSLERIDSIISIVTAILFLSCIVVLLYIIKYPFLIILYVAALISCFVIKAKVTKQINSFEEVEKQEQKERNSYAAQKQREWKENNVNNRPQANVETPQYSREYCKEHCFENIEMYIGYFHQTETINEQQWAINYLDSQSAIITKHLNKMDLVKALQVVENALEMTDPIRDADSRHWFLNSALHEFYALRDEDSCVYNFCLQICYHDFECLPNFFRINDHRFCEDGKIVIEPPHYFIESIYKMAIIFERIGDIKSAIEICDFAIESGIVDSSGKSYLTRKFRLEKKLRNS
jgi:hypothetical protein